MIDDTTTDITTTALFSAAATARYPDLSNQNPAAVYLASLSSESRRTMRTALNTIAGLLGVGEVLDADGHDVRLLVVPWASLRYQHTAYLTTRGTRM